MSWDDGSLYHHYLPAIIFRIFNFQFLFGGMFRAGGERSVPKGQSMHTGGTFRIQERSVQEVSEKPTGMEPHTSSENLGGGGGRGKGGGRGQDRAECIAYFLLCLL